MIKKKKTIDDIKLVKTTQTTFKDFNANIKIEKIVHRIKTFAHGTYWFMFSISCPVERKS